MRVKCITGFTHEEAEMAEELLDKMMERGV